MLDKPGFTTTLQSDENDNLVLEFPDGLLEAMDWKEGDILGIEAFAGRIIFSKVSSEEGGES